MALTKISSNLVADDAIVTGKIADGGVGTADLAANAVTSAKIAQNSILTKHIDDGQVGTAQIAADAITGAKIADDAISEEHLDVTVISSLTEVTAVDGDYVLIGDTSDSNNLKKVLVSSIRESADLLKTEATGDGSTVAYALNEAPSSENATMVFFDGVYQHKSTYSVSGSTLTFDTAPLASTDIEIMASTTAALNVPADDSVQTAKIADNAVTSAKIASNSILTRHIDDDQITGDQLATNIAISGTLSAGGAITGTLATAAQTNITSLGTLTALTVDDITIDGSTISDGGDFTLDVGGDITFDAGGGDILFKDDGTLVGTIGGFAGSNVTIKSEVSDGDVIIQGNDGGSGITALTLDMSDSGTALFNHKVDIATIGQLANVANDLTIYSSTSGHNGLRFHANGILPTDNAGAIVNNDADLGDPSYRFKDLYIGNDILVADSGVLKLGAGDDLQLWHDGSDSYIKDTGTGNLLIQFSDLYMGDGTNHFLVVRDNGTTGNVLINNTSSIANASLDDLQVGSGSGNTGMTIYSGTSNYGGIAFADGNTGSSDQYPGLLEYFHTDNALQFYTNAALRMRLMSDGEVVCGPTALADTYAPLVNGLTSGALVVGRHSTSGSLGIWRTNTMEFKVYHNGQGYIMTWGSDGVIDGDFNDTSDVNLKENISTIADGTTVIKSLRPVKFDWKDTKKGNNQHGFIAQEVETVLPNAVRGNDYVENKTGLPEDEPAGNGKNMNSNAVLAHAVKAIQELEARIKTLEG